MDDDNEMNLIEGEILEQIEQIDEGWWQAVGDNGTKAGLFPCTFLTYHFFISFFSRSVESNLI